MPPTDAETPEMSFRLVLKCPELSRFLPKNLVNLAELKK